MSRRPPNPAAERAAQNTQTIKSLLKLEGNKTCADCKRNKRKLQLCRVLPQFSLANRTVCQIQDGQAGTWASSFAYGVQASIEEWEHISAESNPWILTPGQTSSYKAC
jgi:hypothetical protein